MAPALITVYKLCAVRARMCSVNQAHHQYKRVDHQVLVQGELLRNTS